MADRSLHYGSLGRQALASSYSTLDGVPFKISSNFKQPETVIGLPVLEGSGSSNGFNEEYSFETEEAVLAWAQARDEAIKKAHQEEAEKAEKAAAAQKDAATRKQQEACTDSESSDENIQKEQQNDSNNQSLMTRPKPPVPKPAPRPGIMLKPTLIQQPNKANNGTVSDGGKTTVPTVGSKEGFDITMFEQEGDPFDNLELQTINDMEELKVLLDSSSNHISGGNGEGVQSNGQNQIPTSISQPNVNVSESFYELAGPIMTNTWVTFDSSDLSQQRGSPTLTSTDSNKNSNMAGSSDSLVSESGEYVKLTSGPIQPPHDFKNSNLSGVTAQPSSDPTANISTQQQGNPFGSKLPPHLAGSDLFKPVLPPIPKPRKTSVVEIGTNHVVYHNEADQAKSTVLPASSLPSSTVDILPTDRPAFAGAKPANGFKPARIAPPPPVAKPTPAAITQADNSAKMWSSVGPTLASCLDNGKEEANQSNPYSRHSMEWHGTSKTPDLSQGQSSSPSPSAEKLTQSSSSTQLWNRYRPLPPAPSPKPCDTQASSQHPPSQAVGLTDPYHSLSKEGQEFTDQITSMGFLRAKVARAVEKFGQDQREVLDHLIAVDTLEQKKFAPLYAEKALHSCQNDCEKAERFLKMQSQFEELGFASEKIQEALIKSDMIHDKALDLLTACSP